MNEKIIMGMVEPYLKDQKLTYKEFEKVFRMLSTQEQYSVLKVLHQNDIDLVEDASSAENSEDNEDDRSDFEILYDEELFAEDDEEGNTSDEKPESDDYLKVRKKITLSNRALIRMIQQGNAQAKQDLCIANQGLVDKWVSKYQHVYRNKMEFEDLEQAGMIGLIKAAERFDLDYGTEFSTYAVTWIRQCITREIMDRGYTVRIPVHKMEQIYRVLRSDAKFAYEKDYNKRLELIAEAAKLPVVVVEECLQIHYQFLGLTSLDLPIGEEEDTPLMDLLPMAEETSVEDIVIQQEMREKLEYVLGTLREKEQDIIRLRFGLDDGAPKTLEEIGKKYHVTRERIRQIEAKALKKLKHPTRSKYIRGYWE